MPDVYMDVSPCGGAEMTWSMSISNVGHYDLPTKLKPDERGCQSKHALKTGLPLI